MTKKKTRYKSALLNTLIVLLFLSLSGASLWLFYKDLTASSTRSDKDQIATVTFKHKIAQRKYNDRVIWERLNQDSPLYSGDTIHTANLAQADIGCQNNAAISIFENTMLQIFLDKDGNLRVSVGSGNIQVDATNATSDVVLQMEGASLNVRGAKLNAQEGIISVLQGSAELDGQNFTAGQSARVLENGGVARMPITVTSLAPFQTILLFADAGGAAIPSDAVSQSVLLEWAPVQSAKNIIVETSAQKDFSVVKDSFTVSGKNKVELPAAEGALFWRVYFEDEPQNAAQGKINFEEVPAVQARFPQDSGVFSNYKQPAQINLVWSGNDYAQKYKVELSKDAAFTQVELLQETNSQNLALGALPQGEYFWRVTPCYPDGYGVPCQEKSFGVTDKELPPQKAMLPPPVLIEPSANFVIGPAYLEKNRSIMFVWESVPDATEYDFVLYQKDEDGGLKEIYSALATTQTQVELNDLTILDIAPFQWQVTARIKSATGFVIQDGENAAQEFKIDFALPGEVRQYNPGVRYVD